MPLPEGDRQPGCGVRVFGRYSPIAGTLVYNSRNRLLGHARGLSYQELGADYFDKRHAERAARWHVRQLEAMGFHVTRKQRNFGVRSQGFVYIAGMTDRVALDEHRKLFDPLVRV